MPKTYRLVVAACACLLLLASCKYMAFTHEGAVKATTEEFFRYLDKGQWNAAAELMDLEKFEFAILPKRLISKVLRPFKAGPA